MGWVGCRGAGVQVHAKRGASLGPELQGMRCWTASPALPASSREGGTLPLKRGGLMACGLEQRYVWCKNVYMHLCIYDSVYVCCICAHVYVNVCICSYIYIHMCSHAFVDMCNPPSRLTPKPIWSYRLIAPNFLGILSTHSLCQLSEVHKLLIHVNVLSNYSSSHPAEQFVTDLVRKTVASSVACLPGFVFSDHSSSFFSWCQRHKFHVPRLR